MKNNFPKIPLFISIIFLALFCVALFLLYQAINNSNQKAEENTIKLETENSRRDDIKTLNHLLETISGDRIKLESHFAPSSNIVPFLDSIEKMAPTVGASVQVDSINTTVDKTGLLIGLKASGSFEAVYKFLTLLENSPYELDFISVDVHKTNAEDSSDKNAKGSKWEAVFKIQLLSFIP